MTPRLVSETQRAYVERALTTEGRIATFDALYNLAYADGRKCSITRLAAVIHTLRHDAGWDIAEHHDAGLAVYRLVAKPPTSAAHAVPEPRPVPVPTWAQGWRCPDCGSAPASEPQSLLGDMGRAYCRRCDASRLFRKVAA